MSIPPDETENAKRTPVAGRVRLALFYVRYLLYLIFQKFLYTNGKSCAILYRVDVPAALRGAGNGCFGGPPKPFLTVFFQAGTRFPAGQIINTRAWNPGRGTISGVSYSDRTDVTKPPPADRGRADSGRLWFPMPSGAQDGQARRRYIFFSIKKELFDLWQKN